MKYYALQELFDKNPGNVIASPVSLSTLLAIVHQASAASTRQQLTQVLHAGPQALRSGYSQIIYDIKVSHTGQLDFKVTVMHFLISNEECQLE